MGLDDAVAGDSGGRQALPEQVAGDFGSRLMGGKITAEVRSSMPLV